MLLDDRTARKKTNSICLCLKHPDTLREAWGIFLPRSGVGPLVHSFGLLKCGAVLKCREMTYASQARSMRSLDCTKASLHQVTQPGTARVDAACPPLNAAMNSVRRNKG